MPPGVPDWGQLPIWVIAVVVILKVVFDFLKDWRSKKGESGSSAEEKKLAVILKKLDPIEQKVGTVYSIVTRTDPDGTPLIYNRSSMEEAIRSLTVVLGDVKTVLTDLHRENKHQTDILKAVAEEQHRQSERLARLSADLPRMRASSAPGV